MWWILIAAILQLLLRCIHIAWNALFCCNVPLCRTLLPSDGNFIIWWERTPSGNLSECCKKLINTLASAHSGYQSFSNKIRETLAKQSQRAVFLHTGLLCVEELQKLFFSESTMQELSSSENFIIIGIFKECLKGYFMLLSYYYSQILMTIH